MEKWQDPQVIALWIAIAVALVFTILLFVVRIMYTGYKRMAEANLREANLQIEHQKKLMETSLQAQEKERMRIAADLHDGLIGKLTAIRMQSQIANAPESVDVLLKESITEARRISHDLTPPLLEYSSLSELIQELLYPWEKKYTINFYGDIRHNEGISVDYKLQLIRIVQELLTNTIKHAEADVINIHLRHTEDYLCLKSSDNGIGFKPGLLKKGLGMNSLEMRTQYLNAHYKIKPKQGKGTTALILLSLR